MAIRFGTSGWRAVIADDFTFAGVREVTEAICAHLETNDEPQKSVIIGHDTCSLGENGLPIYQTPVGFKFIGELINEDKIILGGEESAGLSIKGHYPEKDGILACLLAAEAVAARGESVTQQLTKLHGRVGRLEAGRIGVRLTDDLMKSLAGRLNQNPSATGGRA
jgi:phosphomannomutase